MKTGRGTARRISWMPGRRHKTIARLSDTRERNLRRCCQVGEIDIIAEKDDLLCFVEVKTRLSDTYGAGRLAVNRPKQRHLRAAAQVYLQEYTGSCREISFDLIEIRAEHLRGLAI